MMINRYFRMGMALLVLSAWVIILPDAAYPEASISGIFEMNYRHIEDDADNENTSDQFNVEDVMIFIKGDIGEKASFFSEFMVNPNSADDEIGEAHDQSVRVERIYLSTRKLIPNHSLKAGQYQVFDGPIKDYHNAMGNPLPGDIIFFNNPWAGHHGSGTLHDVFAELGLGLSGSQGQFSYILDVFNGRADITPERSAFDDAEPTGVFGKVLWTSMALPGLQAGVSYFKADGTEDEVTEGGTTLLGSPEDTFWIGELIYRTPTWTLTGMYLDGEQTRLNFDENDDSFDNEGSGWLAEAVYRATSKLSLVGRYQTIDVDDPNEMNFLGAGAEHGHGGATVIGDVEQIELGVNYRWSPRIIFKASWQGNEEDGEDAAGDRIFGQIAASF